MTAQELVEEYKAQNKRLDDLIEEIVGEDGFKAMKELTIAVLSEVLKHVDPNIPGARDMAFKLTDIYMDAMGFALWVGANKKRIQ